MMAAPAFVALFVGFFLLGAGIVAGYRSTGRFALACAIGGIGMIVGTTAAVVLP
jgi:hypothetical protein